MKSHHMGFIRGLRNSLVMKTGTEKYTAHRSTQRGVGRETQRGRSEKCMGWKAQRNTQKGTSVRAFKTHPHIPRWCPHKIVTTQQQHNLNTVVGLDMKMTLQTTPTHPRKPNGCLQEPQNNIYRPELNIV